MGVPPSGIRPVPGGAGAGARLAGPPPRVGMAYQPASTLPPPMPPTIRPPQQLPAANNSQILAAPDATMSLPTGLYLIEMAICS